MLRNVMETHLYYTGQLTLWIHAGSPHTSAAWNGQRNLCQDFCSKKPLKNKQCTDWGKEGSKKRIFQVLFMQFLQMPNTFILFYLYFCAMAFQHIECTHLLHIIIQMKNEIHVFSFYMSHRLPIQIFHTIQGKMDKNRRLLKINGEVREL